MENEPTSDESPSSEPSVSPSSSGGKRGRKLPPGIKPGQRRGPDGRLLPNKPKEPALSSESEGELAAMRWVTTHAPGEERTWEQRYAREFKESQPASFWSRKAKLEEAAAEAEKASTVPPGTVKPKWDGIGACPTCGHEAEKAIEDDGAARILAMLDELDRLDDRTEGPA